MEASAATEDLLRTIVTTLGDLQIATQATFDEDEAAAYLKCSRECLDRYTLRTRQIPYCPVGRNRVYLKQDLDAFLNSIRRNGTSPRH